MAKIWPRFVTMGLADKGRLDDFGQIEKLWAESGCISG